MVLGQVIGAPMDPMFSGHFSVVSVTNHPFSGPIVLTQTSTGHSLQNLEVPKALHPSARDSTAAFTCLWASLERPNRPLKNESRGRWIFYWSSCNLGSSTTHMTWTRLRIREQRFCCAGSTFFGVGQDKHRIEMNWSHPRGKRKVPLFQTSCEGQWEFAARAHGKPAKHAQRSSHCCPRCVGNDVLHYTFWHFFPQDFTNLCIEIAICAGKFQFTPCSPQSALITSCRPFADPGSNTYAAVPVGSLPMQMGVPAGASFPAGTEARPMPRKAVAWGGACLLFLFQRPRLKERRWDTNEASGLRYEHCSRWHCPWHNWKNADWCSTNLSK